MKIFATGMCLFSLILTRAAFAADDDKTVGLTDTPAAAQQAMAARIGDGKIEEIDRSREGGEMIFEVNFDTKAGQEHDFTVSDDGTLLCVGVELSETPAAVQKTVQAEVHGGEITGINKNVADTEVSYDVEVKRDGREMSFNIADDGVLSSREVALADTPAAVQTAIQARTVGGTVDSIDENLDAEGNSFDVEATTKDGAAKSFSVAPDGRLLSEGVTLEQTPPTVRRTIEQRIGNGKVLEIDRSLSERKAGVLPYEVSGRKDGRPFDFSVGPRGRFLGMDD